MIKLLAKWTVLVCLNAAISFHYALTDARSPAEIMGMVAGVVTFIGFYATIERWALQKGWDAFVLRLSIATAIKACTQFFPVLELWAGAWASIAIGAIIPERGLFQAYFITLLDGFLLSIVVGILVGLMFLTAKLYQVYQTSKSAD